MKRLILFGCLSIKDKAKASRQVRVTKLTYQHSVQKYITDNLLYSKGYVVDNFFGSEQLP